MRVHPNLNPKAPKIILENGFVLVTNTLHKNSSTARAALIKKHAAEAHSSRVKLKQHRSFLATTLASRRKPAMHPPQEQIGINHMFHNTEHQRILVLLQDQLNGR